jgi:hypothetical protein
MLPHGVELPEWSEQLEPTTTSEDYREESPDPSPEPSAQGRPPPRVKREARLGAPRRRRRQEPEEESSDRLGASLPLLFPAVILIAGGLLTYLGAPASGPAGFRLWILLLAAGLVALIGGILSYFATPAPDSRRVRDDEYDDLDVGRRGSYGSRSEAAPEPMRPAPRRATRPAPRAAPLPAPVPRSFAAPTFEQEFPVDEAPSSPAGESDSVLRELDHLSDELGRPKPKTLPPSRG